MYLLDDKPNSALTWSIEAIKLYRQAKQPDSEGSAEVLAAHALIALAEGYPEGTVRDKHVNNALHHLALARQIAHEQSDQGFTYLVLLAQAAHEGAMGRWAAAIKHVTHVLDHASEPVLLAQAWSILGDIQQMQGHIEQATTSYRSALIVLEHSEFSVFGVRARRVLMQTSESALD